MQLFHILELKSLHIPLKTAHPHDEKPDYPINSVWSTMKWSQAAKVCIGLDAVGSGRIPSPLSWPPPLAHLLQSHSLVCQFTDHTDSAEGSHILKPGFIKALHRGRSAQCSVTFPSISPLHHLVQPCRSDGRRADSKVTAPLLIFIHSLLFLLQIEFRKLSWCKFTSIQLLEIKAQMPSV